ncbi:hypothetical protein AAC387_Pa12g0539 [Persea americana]
MVLKRRLRVPIADLEAQVFGDRALDPLASASDATTLPLVPASTSPSVVVVGTPSPQELGSTPSSQELGSTPPRSQRRRVGRRRDPGWRPRPFFRLRRQHPGQHCCQFAGPAFGGQTSWSRMGGH